MYALRHGSVLVNVDLTKQEDLTPATTKAVLNAFSKGTKPKPGPQTGRHTSENSAGLTALTSKASPLSFVPRLYGLIDNDIVQPYGPGEHCQPDF